MECRIFQCLLAKSSVDFILTSSEEVALEEPIHVFCFSGAMFCCPLPWEGRYHSGMWLPRCTYRPEVKGTQPAQPNAPPSRTAIAGRRTWTLQSEQSRRPLRNTQAICKTVMARGWGVPGEVGGVAACLHLLHIHARLRPSQGGPGGGKRGWLITGAGAVVTWSQAWTP